MKKADGWSMGQEEQKKKALEEKLRRRVYTAAFEAAQQRKEKPWQSWDEAFSERLAKQPFITEEERKPFAPSGAGAQNAFYTGEKQPWPGLGEAWPGQARRAERTPWAALSENPPSGAGPCFWRGSAGAWRRPRRAGSRLPGRSRARPALRLRAWTRRTATRCMRGRRWRSCCGPSGGRRARRPAKHCSPAGDMVH